MLLPDVKQQILPSWRNRRMEKQFQPTLAWVNENTRQETLPGVWRAPSGARSVLLGA
jgi:hypothetical protein